jgi:DNA-binding ferritin-like protein
VVPVSCGGKKQNNSKLKKTNHMKTPELKPGPLVTKTSRALSDLSEKGVKEISASLQELLDQHNDVATASLIENWIDETESRAWFLYETINRA